jgi:hypothetical protein
MKRGTPQHPKVVDLAAKLKIPRYAAVGILESLWHFTAQYTPAGDVGKHTDQAIAFHIGWENAPETLLNALCASRWIDKNAHCRLYVHDWHEHAEDSVHITLTRKTLLFANGMRPSMSRLTREERKACEEAYLELERTKNAPETLKSVLETPCLSLSHALAMPMPTEKESTPSCPEPASTPLPAEPALLTFPCVGPVKTWALTQKTVDVLAQAYPDLDVMVECRKAVAWCECNKPKRKTAKGMPKFLNNWVAQANDHQRKPAAYSGQPQTAQERKRDEINKALDEWADGKQEAAA